MGFLKYKDIIEDGDLVIVYLSRTSYQPITVKAGDTLNTRFGSFPHDTMIGKKYGSQLITPKGLGYIYLLFPTPELWTLSLPHRTQIVYTQDSSYIIERMNVISGSRVIEAGTGSGSFTHAFARSVGTKGTVFTYEFHEERYLKAKEEFHSHGLDECVVFTHRDVCADGFEVKGLKEPMKADVVFLDLPSPWEAIPHLDKVIAKDRKVSICCFSPCVEQVVKTVEALTENGWLKPEMTEVSGITWEARKEMCREVDDAIKRLKDVKQRQREGLDEVRKMASEGPKPEDWDEKHNRKRTLEERDRGFNPFGKGRRVAEGEEGYEWFDVSKAEQEIKTHTSYLTFACKVPQLKPSAVSNSSTPGKG